MGNTPSGVATGQHPSVTTETVQVTDEDDIAALFDSLNDPDACAIVRTLDDTPLSAKEISDRCNLPLSTTYRKINQLARIGLLDERTQISRTGKHTSKYHTSVETISVTIADDGFELRLSSHE